MKLRVLAISFLLFLIGLCWQTPAFGAGRSVYLELDEQRNDISDLKGEISEKLLSQYASNSIEISKARKEVRALTAEMQSAGDEFRENIKGLLRDPVLRSGVTAVYVVDAYTGKPLFLQHVDKFLNPASNVKLIVTAAAMDAFGPDWRYETFFAGEKNETVGISDLYLMGSGDPTLEARNLESLVNELARAGIKMIDGDLVLFSAALLPRGKGLELDLVVFGRTSKIFSGSDRSSTGSAEKSLPVAQVLVSGMPSFLRLESRVRIEKGADSNVTAVFELNSTKPGDKNFLGTIVVSGVIRPDDMVRLSPEIDNSYVRTAEVLLEAFKQNGINLEGDVRAGDPNLPVFSDKFKHPGKLAVHKSATMSELVTVTNKSSNNYLADSLAASLGAYVYGGGPCMDKGVAAMKRWLVWRTGIDTRTMILDTGSGLSYKTRISARQLIRVLRVAGGYRMPIACPPRVSGGSGNGFWVCDQKNRLLGKSAGETDAGKHRKGFDAKDLSRVFRESLAVAHKDGTLRRRMTYLDLKGDLIGKTGTLRGISALSGFMENGDGNRVVFSIVTNGADRFQRTTLRRRHGWFVGHLDDYMASRRNLLERLARARERLSAGLERLQRSAEALLPDEAEIYKLLSYGPVSIARPSDSGDFAFSKNADAKWIYLAGLDQGNVVSVGGESNRPEVVLFESMAALGRSFGTVVSMAAAWKVGGMGMVLPGALFAH